MEVVSAVKDILLAPLDHGVVLIHVVLQRVSRQSNTPHGLKAAHGNEACCLGVLDLVSLICDHYVCLFAQDLECFPCSCSLQMIAESESSMPADMCYFIDHSDCWALAAWERLGIADTEWHERRLHFLVYAAIVTANWSWVMYAYQMLQLMDTMGQCSMRWCCRQHQPQMLGLYKSRPQSAEHMVQFMYPH